MSYHYHCTACGSQAQKKSDTVRKMTCPNHCKVNKSIKRWTVDKNSKRKESSSPRITSAPLKRTK